MELVLRPNLQVYDVEPAALRAYAEGIFAFSRLLMTQIHERRRTGTICDIHVWLRAAKAQEVLHEHVQLLLSVQHDPAVLSPILRQEAQELFQRSRLVLGPLRVVRDTLRRLGDLANNPALPEEQGFIPLSGEEWDKVVQLVHHAATQTFVSCRDGEFFPSEVAAFMYANSALLAYLQRFAAPIITAWPTEEESVRWSKKLREAAFREADCRLTFGFYDDQQPWCDEEILPQFCYTNSPADVHADQKRIAKRGLARASFPKADQ